MLARCPPRSLTYSFIIGTSPVCVTTLIIYIIYPHSSLVGILVSRSSWLAIIFFNHCFLEDKYDTLEYSLVKATTVLRALANLIAYAKKYQQAFWRRCRGSNWRNDFGSYLDVC